MPKTLIEVSQDAAALPELERLKLARMLLDLSDASPHSSAEAEAMWEQEITRRLQDLRTGKVRGVPINEVQQRIESSFTP